MGKISFSTIAMLLFVAVMLTSCEDYHNSKPVKSDNPSYDVRKLFSVDGVTVYRFLDDGEYVYFTNGNGIVQHTYTELRGKISVTKKRITLCNNKGNGQE